MDVAYPRAALDMIAGTLLISIGMLVFSLVALRSERQRPAQGALVALSLLAQASCVGTAWLSEGKSGASMVLLVITVVSFAVLLVFVARRDPA